MCERESLYTVKDCWPQDDEHHLTLRTTMYKICAVVTIYLPTKLENIHMTSKNIFCWLEKRIRLQQHHFFFLILPKQINYSLSGQDKVENILAKTNQFWLVLTQLLVYKSSALSQYLRPFTAYSI